MNANTKSGVYIIKNIASGKCYVGQSKRIPDRWKSHRHDLRKGVHSSKHMQRSWSIHGEHNFEFSVLEFVECTKDALTACEQKWMDLLRPEFNNVLTAGTNLGCKQPREAVERRAAKIRGRKVSDETKAKIGAANRINMTGRKATEQTKQKMSATRLGRPNIKAGDKLRGRKRPDHVVAALHGANEARYSIRRNEIKSTLIANPFASVTAIAKALNADRDTVSKYRKELECQLILPPNVNVAAGKRYWKKKVRLSQSHSPQPLQLNLPLGTPPDKLQQQ